MSVTGKAVTQIYGGSGLTVNVLEPVQSTWREYRQIGHCRTEACGILIASIDESLDRVWLEYATSPMPMDLRHRHKFKLQDPRHQRFLDICHKRAKGRLFFIGTWHTHPERRPSPSLLDRREWDKISKRSQSKAASVFAIIGIDETKIYVKQRQKYRELSQRWPHYG